MLLFREVDFFADVDLPVPLVLRILSDPAASALLFLATTKIPP
jgi:hypothetical protein